MSDLSQCIRRAWLTLGSLPPLLLEDPTKGYFCTKLDLGSPVVREVVNNRPDQRGTDDRTSLLGSRVVSAEVTALLGAGASVDGVASAFAPFMDPSKRPVLHYILDRPGAAERVLTLRAAAYDFPVSGPYQRDIALQWVAPDPIVRDPVARTQTSWAGLATGPGRVYDLNYLATGRQYPPAGGEATTAVLTNAGDVDAYPVIRIYGPAATPLLLLWNMLVAGQPASFAFEAGFQIDAGHYVDVDATWRTVYRDGDPSQTCFESVDWSTSAWPMLPPGVDVQLQIKADSTSGVTQAQATWQDAYLT